MELVGGEVKIRRVRMDWWMLRWGNGKDVFVGVDRLVMWGGRVC